MLVIRRSLYMRIFFFLSHFSQFSAKMADFEGGSEVETVPFFNLHQKCLDSGQNEGSISFWRCVVVKIQHFPLFSAISASFQLKWLILKAILKSRVFPFSIFIRNVSTLVRMRGQSASRDVSLPIYGIFLYFQPFQPVFSYND